jgi:hypothetical protein
MVLDEEKTGDAGLNLIMPTKNLSTAARCA